MATADLAPGVLDINCAQGDDIVLVCTFNIDLTGYTGWAATALAVDAPAVDAIAFEVDTSQQGSSIITLTLNGNSTATFSRARWNLVVTDPNSHVFYVLAGTITAQTTVVVDD